MLGVYGQFYPVLLKYCAIFLGFPLFSCGNKRCVIPTTFEQQGMCNEESVRMEARERVESAREQ